MNKNLRICLNLCTALTAMLVLEKCKPDGKQENVAAYVGNIEKGLTKKIFSDSDEIVCQWIPEYNLDKKSKDNVFRFNVYLYTKPGKISDSTLYKLNYHAVDVFALLLGADTVKPVLSERIANGRRELNQFTVILMLTKM